MSERMSTEQLAAEIRKQTQKLGGKPLSHDESMARAAKAARIADQKGNR
jgi:hypothetical protein